MPEEITSSESPTTISPPSLSSPSLIKKYRRFFLFFLAFLFLGLGAFKDDIQIRWNYFLLRSQKAEVGDQARNFLVTHYQIALFLRGLRSSDLQVQRQSSFAIHQLWEHPQASKAIPDLLAFVENPKTDTKVRWHSMRALGYLRVPQAVPLLIDVLEQDDILCTNPTCRHYHLWEEAHDALERILEVKQEFHPEESAEHRVRVARQWKKYWEKFQQDSLLPTLDDKKITTPY